MVQSISNLEIPVLREYLKKDSATTQTIDLDFYRSVANIFSMGSKEIEEKLFLWFQLCYNDGKNYGHMQAIEIVENLTKE
jgi:DNA replication initiation complex subunit (GINS family)